MHPVPACLTTFIPVAILLQGGPAVARGPVPAHATATTPSSVAPRLPDPPVADTADPVAFLMAARSALVRGRLGEAREALERAETRLLDRSIDPAQGASPDSRRAAQDIGLARSSLPDRAAAARAIEDAIVAAATPAAGIPVAAVTADGASLPARLLVPPQPAAAAGIQASPAPLAAPPVPPSPVTYALLPGHWELRGSEYEWVPPETRPRQTQDRRFLEAHYTWRDGTWRFVPARYGDED